MTIADVVKKSILPLLFMAFWFWIVKTIMEISGNTGLFWFLFLAGFPFGVHKMCVILVPRQMDIGGTVGVAALSVIIGGLAGSLLIPVYMVRAVYVLLRYALRR